MYWDVTNVVITHVTLSITVNIEKLNKTVTNNYSHLVTLLC